MYQKNPSLSLSLSLPLSRTLYLSPSGLPLGKNAPIDVSEEALLAPLPPASPEGPPDWSNFDFSKDEKFNRLE
jgi:hypothetical protein